MATTLVDDMDGSYGAEKREYSVGGIKYAIDLTDANWAKLLQALQPFINVSRITYDRDTRTVNVPIRDKSDRDKIRAWAIAHNRFISDKGRFPNDIVRDYYAEMDKDPKTFTRG